MAASEQVERGRATDIESRRAQLLRGQDRGIPALRRRRGAGRAAVDARRDPFQPSVLDIGMDRGARDALFLEPGRVNQPSGPELREELVQGSFLLFTHNELIGSFVNR